MKKKKDKKLPKRITAKGDPARSIKKKQNGKNFGKKHTEKPAQKKSGNGLPRKGYEATGLFIAHQKGFGFVELPDEEEDIFIPANQTHHALHHDTVVVKIYEKDNGDRRREGEIRKIIDHELTEVVGTLKKEHDRAYVIPDFVKLTQEVLIPKSKIGDAKRNDKVVALITQYPDKKNPLKGRITEIIGHTGDPGCDVLSIARAAGIPEEFPAKVVTQAERIGEKLIQADYHGRLDLRKWKIVTVDGEDAKDLDDGVSLTVKDGIYHLGVHIADVSNYVQDHSALDREALKRGTSVYLVDRVIPMLPKRLSNGICSLNAGEDRLTLSCLMEIDEKGKVLHYEIAETVIRVTRRMSYHEVDDIITGKTKGTDASSRALAPMFFEMDRLAKLIRARRHRRGAIDFDFPESKVLLDENGVPIDVFAYDRNEATDMIEDFMLTANETVAEEFCKKSIPFVYRSHEEPDPDKVEQVFSLIRAKGYKVEKKGQKVTPREIQKALSKMEGKPEEPLISRLILRSMQQARYTTDCVGHFGLAAKYYCHFTSPIRRYPDLQIHRIIKDTLRGRMNDAKKVYYDEILSDVAQQSSAMERRADETERDTIKLKKTEYMSAHIGERYTGTISGVTGWGFYVELPNTIEGLVHITQLKDDFYEYDEEKMCLVGEHRGHVYSLGDTVDVTVLDADLALHTIDFSLV